MIPLGVAEVAGVVGADPAPDDTSVPSPAGRVTSVVVDSRQVRPGTLFVALPGERVDGHDYVSAAQAAGAVAALTSRPVPGARCLVVPDPRAALGRVARRVVDLGHAGGLAVVGLTGSAGKTTTKDLLAQVLEPQGPTVSPAGSLNNEVGLPLTACRVEPATRFLVAEMGARGPGHIRYLCGLTPPDVALVLNVGSAHLGEFGSREGTARAKGELVEALPADGVAVLNAADPLVAAMADRTSARVVFFDPYGEGDPGARAEVGATGLEADDLGRYTFGLRLPGAPRRGVPVALQTLGRQQVANAVAAAAAAYALGVDPDQIAAALSAARPRSRWRMELTERADGLVVLNDAYNANPESMRAALQALVRLGAGRRTRFPAARTWAVLGEMRELGAGSAAEHAALGAVAAGLGVGHVVAVGQNAAAITTGGNRTGTQFEPVADKEEAVALLADRLAPGDVVLVKASRGDGLETVAQALTQELGETGEAER